MFYRNQKSYLKRLNEWLEELKKINEENICLAITKEAKQLRKAWKIKKI